MINSNAGMRMFDYEVEYFGDTLDHRAVKVESFANDARGKPGEKREDIFWNNGSEEELIETLEAEVFKIQGELHIVQDDRKELEDQRKDLEMRLSEKRKKRGMHTSADVLSLLPIATVPFHTESVGEKCQQAQRNPMEQYDILEQELTKRITEGHLLKKQLDQHKEVIEKAEEEKSFYENRCQVLERKLKQEQEEKNKLGGVKDQMLEKEQQLAVLKAMNKDAQEEIEELKASVQDLTSQLAGYRNKYLETQQQVEEQERKVNMVELDAQKCKDDLNLELQRVKQSFQARLSELTPLPNMLKETQLKLQDSNQLRAIMEKDLEDSKRQQVELKERTTSMLRRLEAEKNVVQEERNQLTRRLEEWEGKYRDIRSENSQLKTLVAKLEETVAQHENCVSEKTQEVANLLNQLQTQREETGRQQSRHKERGEASKRLLQSHIADLERQLAQSRAATKAAQKIQDETRQRLQAQINSLSLNFEQAQQRIKSLQSHVNFLRNSYSGILSAQPSKVSITDSSFILDPQF